MELAFYDSTPSSPMSPLTGMTTEQMLEMDDEEFFDCLEQELGSDFYSSTSSESDEIFFTQNEESRTLQPTPIPNLDIDESHQKISPSEPCIPCSQHSADPEIPSSLGDFPHFPRPPDFSNLPSGNKHNSQVCSSSPTEENKRFHSMDKEDYESHLPKLPTSITLVPEPSESHKTLIDFWSDGSFHLLPSEPKYTIYRVVDKVSPVEIQDTNFEEDTHYVGNSFDPKRRLDVYRAFVRQLNSSDFPFSYEQRKIIANLGNKVSTLHHLPDVRSETIFTPYREEELKLKSDLDLFIDLLANTDYHPVSPTLINRHVAAIVSELEFWIVRDRMIPIIIPGKLPFFVDPATYLISKLEDAFPNSTEEKIEAAFFTRRKESHVKLAQIFSHSKFPFTSLQKLDIKRISEVVLHTNGDPDSKEEKEFLNEIGKLIYNLTFNDQGQRDGISNPKKVRKEFRRLVRNLVELGLEERKFLSEFERYSLFPADLIHTVVGMLYKSFIPRYTFPQPRAPNDTTQSSTDESK